MHPYTRLLFGAIPDPQGEKDVISIPGAPPRLDRETTGCPFRPRCDVAFDRCAADRPALLQISERHRAACHRNDPASEVAS
jgi:oligopeptide/dipeptide ABC transporter ATP-binding protein